MHRILLLLLAPAWLLVPATAEVPRTPSYQVELTSNADGRTWSGRESVTFTNT
ncbi:hypothetical protein ACIBG5_13025 [Kribbella sp. NPDC050241]|uniref:hypothetical protein n=1 Tax=Kribbella sp. NPDC050241 TaxID=3364115 RepID=UPI0037AE4FF7